LKRSSVHSLRMMHSRYAALPLIVFINSKVEAQYQPNIKNIIFPAATKKRLEFTFTEALFVNIV